MCTRNGSHGKLTLRHVGTQELRFALLTYNICNNHSHLYLVTDFYTKVPLRLLTLTPLIAFRSPILKRFFLFQLSTNGLLAVPAPV